MIKQLLPYMKNYKRPFFLGCLCAALESVFELLIPLVMSYIVDVGIQNKDIEYTIEMGILMVALALIALLLGIGSARFSSITGQGFGAELREAQFNKIQSYSFKNIEKFSTSSLITRLTGDVNAMQMSVTMGMRILIRAPIMLIFALILSIYINASLAMVFAVSIPVLVIAVALILRRVGPHFTHLQGRVDALNVTVQENLTGIRVVKSFVRRRFEKQKFNTSNTEMMNASQKAFGLVVINMPIMQLVIFSTIIAIMWFGGNMVYSGTLQVGKLTSFLTYVNQILISLMMISFIFMMVSRSIASAKRILEVLNEVPDIVDDKDTPHHEVKNGDITFSKVGFKYKEDSPEHNLQDIDLTIRSGQTIGIIGGTGSGKTSLTQLIPRLYDVTKGSVLVGGYDVRQYNLDTLRNAVAMVLQKNTLFSGTIRENLLWGNEQATQEQVETACSIANADEFINRLSKGYDTTLEQGGINLSGGQKQRLCIARAILKEPKVLILDDSTSAVDTATEAEIKRALKNQLKHTTKIIIAQRISSVSDADQIIILDDGKISSLGTHEELLQTSEIYQDLFTSQQEGVGFNG